MDRALRELHEALGGSVSVFVLEHGRLWAVGRRGAKTIADGQPLDGAVVDGAVIMAEVQPAQSTGSVLAVPLSTEAGVIGVLRLETPLRLPPQGEAAVRQLAALLAGPADRLRLSRASDLSPLAHLFVSMSSLREPSAISAVAVCSLCRVLPLETSVLLLADADGGLTTAAAWHAPGATPEPLALPALEKLWARLDDCTTFELLDTAVAGVPELVVGSRSLVLIPLRANGSEMGVVVGASGRADDLEPSQREIAVLLAAHAAASLEAAIALVHERRSAETDPLTGLLNRRGLEKRLDRELCAAHDQRLPLSLLVLDCDDFKDVNDRAGHEFGDALLREVGLVLRTVSPDGCEPARFGGDEFVLLLPGMAGNEALSAAETVRRDLGAGLGDAGFPIRLSAGVATYPYDGAGTTQLLRAADQGLYRAKARGKDCVISFREAAHGAGTRERSGADRTQTGAAEARALLDVMEAARSICAESSVADVLQRLGRAASFVIGATATVISRVEGPRLLTTATHALRDVSLDGEESYLIDDYPVTKEVLEAQCVRSISFLDEDLDNAEAFVLRELGMNASMLLPLLVRQRSWGLVEVYDMRMRRFTAEEEAVARFLVDEAGKQIELLGGAAHSQRGLSRLRRRLGAQPRGAVVRSGST